MDDTGSEWLSPPLGSKPAVPAEQDSVEEQELSDDAFHAALGAVPIERLNSAPRHQPPPPPPLPEPGPAPRHGTVAARGGEATRNPWDPTPPRPDWDLPGGDPDGINESPFFELTGTTEASQTEPAVQAHGGFDDLDDLFAEPAVDAVDDLFAEPALDAFEIQPEGEPQVDDHAALFTGPSSNSVEVEELQIEEPRIEEPRIEEPRIEEPHIEELQAEQLHTEELHTDEQDIAVAPVDDLGTEDPGEAFDGGIEDLFGEATEEPEPPVVTPEVFMDAAPQVFPTPATRPALRGTPAPVLVWSGGDDQYADEHIKEAAARIAARAGGYNEVTTLIRGFRLTRDAALDAEQRYDFEVAVRPLMPKMGLTLSVQDLPRTLDLVYDEILGLGPLGAAWRAPEVTEIMVDGWDNVVVEVGGVLHRTDLRFRSPEHAAQVARSLAEMVSDRQLSPNSPLVTAKLDGARVNFAYGPVVPDIGLSISIRKFDSQMTMSGLLEVGALNPEMAELLGALVQAKATVLVSGATGAGKTTMIAAVAESIPGDERIITIEDARELDLGERLSWVPMQTKERASADDNALVGQDALLENCLRMRPDRIIVGEIRDGKAAAVMLSAANTGHEGTMTTIHANSASEALNSRLVRLVRRVEDSPIDVVREEIAEAFHLAVQITRRRGKRFVSEIAEVSPEYIDGQDKIVPRTLWRGKLDANGTVVFTHVAGIDPKGRLVERLADIGVDVSAFTAS
jgi:pilus assembly protein CpaF